MVSRAIGAYGLIPIDPIDTRWLSPVDNSQWTPWHFRYDTVTDHTRDAPVVVADDHAILPSLPHGRVRVDRATSTTVIEASPAAGYAFAHPHLASTAVMHAEWNARLAFHGGAILDSSGRAWGVLGDRGAGKSTFLAWCTTNDIPIVADDIIITDGHTVFAGPRCIDLRKGAAQEFGIGTDIGVVGTRRRWRHALGPVPAQTKLGGWIILRWGAEVSIQDAPDEQRLRLLSSGRALLVRQEHPMAWLQALSVPIHVFTRPQDWKQMDSAMKSVIDMISPPFGRSM